jgi:hypothetical protein
LQALLVAVSHRLFSALAQCRTDASALFISVDRSLTGFAIRIVERAEFDVARELFIRDRATLFGATDTGAAPLVTAFNCPDFTVDFSACVAPTVRR